MTTETSTNAGLGNAFVAITEHALLSDDPDVVAGALEALDDLGRELRESRAQVEEHLIAVMDGHDMASLITQRGSRVERKRSASRRGWDHDGATQAVLRHVDSVKREMDPETGEVESDAEVAVRLLRECASIGSWKKRLTELTGTSMDEWCSESWTDAVSLTRPKR